MRAVYYLAWTMDISKTMNETQIKPVVLNDADDAGARELEERLREEARRYEHDLRELARHEDIS